VKVHYVCFDNCYDEWKDENEVEVLGHSSVDMDMPKSQTYSLYIDLSLRIERALSCGRKA